MSEARRAAIFCRTYLPYSETFIHDQLRHHVRWEPEVFCRETLNLDRFPHPWITTPGGTAEKLAYRATTWSPRFARRLREGGHRLIHAHFGTSGIYALTYARRLRLPLAVTFHGYDLGALVGSRRAEPRLWRYWALSGSLLRRADLFLCPSVEFQEILARLSGRPAAARLHRLGIDLARFAARPRAGGGPPQVVMVGRFVEKKGHLDGLAAFARAAAAAPDARLVLVGAGPLEGAYRARIAALGLEGRVALPGVLPAARVAELLAESDVLLAPSRLARDGDRESGVIVVKEASASALPVIGTRHGGIPEIVDDGATGYLVGEGDVAGMAERLAALLADAALRARMGAAGRAKMEREYDVRAQVAELERVYDELAGL